MAEPGTPCGDFTAVIVEPFLRIEIDTSFMQKPMLFLTAAAVVALTYGTSVARAATLNAVPMQGGMVMPMVSYLAEQGRLQVMMPAEVPQLTPLMVSHPGDSFDPADPWFDALDPSRQGRLLQSTLRLRDGHHE